MLEQADIKNPELPELPGHAIGVTLFNAEEQPALFVDREVNGHQLTCEITNVSDSPLIIPGLKGKATKDNYHFSIRFRLGILAENNIESLMDLQLWNVSDAIHENDGITVYFLYTGENTIELVPRGFIPKEENQQGIVQLIINGLRASGRNGARTTRVQILYQQIHYRRTPERLLSGTRLHFLNIINHLGHRNSPLIYTWAHNHQILNNGKGHDLTLHILNPLRDRDITFSDATRFLFSVDTEEHGRPDESLLVHTKTLENISFSFLDADEKTKSFKENTQRVRVLTAKELGLESLKANNHVHINVTITTDLPEGVGFIHIRQESLPGFWDVSFALPVEKTPLITKGANVGIGVDSPEERLEVDGNIQTETGFMGTGEHGTGYAAFGNKKLAKGAKTYALLQRDTGDTFLNASLGKSIHLRVANVDKMHVTQDGNVNVSGKVQEKGNDLLPAGAIIMWSGKGNAVPGGWILCDGNNNTPNLIDRFIMGGTAKEFDDKDTTRVNGTNEMTLTEKHLPAHNHDIDVKVKEGGKHRHHFKIYKRTGVTKQNMTVFSASSDDKKVSFETENDGAHSHNIEATIKSAGSGVPFDYRPAFYTLAFIMKT